jgi:hypothetical protein
MLKSRLLYANNVHQEHQDDTSKVIANLHLELEELKERLRQMRLHTDNSRKKPIKPRTYKKRRRMGESERNGQQRNHTNSSDVVKEVKASNFQDKMSTMFENITSTCNKRQGHKLTVTRLNQFVNNNNDFGGSKLERGDLSTWYKPDDKKKEINDIVCVELDPRGELIMRVRFVNWHNTEYIPKMTLKRRKEINKRKEEDFGELMNFKNLEEVPFFLMN